MKLIIILLVFLSTILSACSFKSTSNERNSATQNISEQKPVLRITDESKIKSLEVENIQINISLKKSEYKIGDEITYSITNHSDKEVQFGEDIGLETKIDNIWKSVEIDNYVIPAIGYGLMPGATTEELHIGFESELMKGTYRFIKAISYINESESKKFHIISNEFQVQ